MNYFLQINKKNILFLIFFLLIFFFIYLVINNFDFKQKKNLNLQDKKNTTYDILNPKFTINKTKEKISVTAKEGNFLDNNKVLLQNKVIFQSNNFTLLSDNVIYNQKEQVANSNTSSVFHSDGIEIKSNGFSIIDGGNMIEFNGKSKLIISK